MPTSWPDTPVFRIVSREESATARLSNGRATLAGRGKVFCSSLSRGSAGVVLAAYRREAAPASTGYPRALSGRAGRSGFSLTEFMVVSILICMTMLLISTGVGHVRERLKVQQCQSSLRDLGMAISLYSSLWGEKLVPARGPSDDNLRPLYPDCIKSFEAFICPATDNRVNVERDLEDNAPDGRVGAPGHSYQYLSHYLYDRDGRELADPVPKSWSSIDARSGRVWLLMDAVESGTPKRPDMTDNHWEIGANVLFGDFHLEWIEQERWADEFRAGNAP